MRCRYDVKLPNMRSALDYVRKQFKSSRPLVDQTFQTDKLDLFVERYGNIINTIREGQRTMKYFITTYLQRVDRDSLGVSVRLYPFTCDSESILSPKDDPRVVVMNLTVSFGRPVIAGTGIPVSAIYGRYRAGNSVADLAKDIRLSTGAVEKAIRCEAA